MKKPISAEQDQDLFGDVVFSCYYLSMNIEKAQQLATIAHEGRLDRAGQPEIEHPARVAAKCEDEDTIVVAWVHDTVEDTDYTLEYLREQGLTEVQAEALYGITRQEGETYKEYIARMAAMEGRAGEITRADKLADLDENLSRASLPESEQMNRKRYRPAQKLLREAQIAHGDRYRDARLISSS
jgi:(p)ppGpp synthase/HD superfamily hydrolase